jgi:hypothetical protein
MEPLWSFGKTLLRNDSSENKYLETMRAIPGDHGFFSFHENQRKKKRKGDFHK